MLMQAKPQFDEFDDVFESLMSRVTALQTTEMVPLLAAQNRVLAEDIFSPMNVPDKAISAMDGYALNLKDGTAFLKIAASQFAGPNISEPLAKGECIKIMTGAVIPDNGTAVIPVEMAAIQQRLDGDYLFNPKNELQTQHIKTVGSDIKLGQVLARKGTQLNAKLIGVLSSVGIAEVEVSKRSKVALLTLGDELGTPGKPLANGAVFNANWYLLESLLQKQNIDYLGHWQLQDDLQEIDCKIQQLSKQADLILSIGGSSQGDKDWMPKALSTAQDFQRFKLNMKPAKPLLYAYSGKAHVLALPGNPIAAFFSFQLFAVPFLQKLSGRIYRDFSQPAKESLRLTQAISSTSKLRWMPVIKQDCECVPLQIGSSQLALLCQADGFVRIEANQDYPLGSRVNYWQEL
ncbi:molybdopterin molybdotransferase MoeA [Thiomicrorhabdus sp. 6S2-11]|uniref:Molybdopterin molybdenumtransferase n=1 Tax=Thiomicrorhabdus marina TaxID=2818442 RepID=A0ABS3Q1H9_9GAMM|nr:molybdopterin molybdotransferase MoeA [Thiomicrorhabdus marina]MBO1926131.1 molybdopterin molybdotransferase MoeA [Thiomicrorhabdus marina]